jgi:oxygen-independent coproporphyrinogen III oxidase
MEKSSIDSLLKKYDVPVPRYTSYPPVPYWNANDFPVQSWLKTVERTFYESNASKGISLYLHLPFCESLCTYCACNTRITKNHGVEQQYAKSLLQEWARYQKIFAGDAIIRELHLGGGTPTFFSPENLEYLLLHLLADAKLHPSHEFSFEGHPNNTTKEHLKVLYNAGFRRVSYGVQDLDPKVQKTINRIQPFKNVERVVLLSREVGYTSIGFDLIYGLPYQTIESISNTMRSVLSLRPDRIAFYSYAHVPWLKPGQRGYEDADLPSDVVKRTLYETGRKLLLDDGYIDIGMDHFSLPHDTLAKAFLNKDLHRNFMGYTTSSTDLLIGLGASSISDSKYAYAQNVKSVEAYQKKVDEGNLAITKGHRLSLQEGVARQCILSIACNGQLDRTLMDLILDDEMLNQLRVMEQEGIVAFSGDGLIVTNIGRAFIRNICRVFDTSSNAISPVDKNTFSRAI